MFGYRRLTIRYERNADHFCAFPTLAAALVCFKKLAKSNHMRQDLSRSSFPYEVTATDSEVFKIVPYGQCGCTWYAKLFWSTDNKNGESVINDGVEPFRIASARQAKVTYDYDDQRKQWYICPKGSESSCAMN